MTAVFVTAIGTDCGKTHVASALLREIAGRKPFALKPLMTGCATNKACAAAVRLWRSTTSRNTRSLSVVRLGNGACRASVSCATAPSPRKIPKYL